MEQLQLLFEGFFGLVFQNFEEQAEFSDLHGLGVNVHAKNVIKQDFFFLGSG